LPKPPSQRNKDSQARVNLVKDNLEKDNLEKDNPEKVNQGKDNLQQVLKPHKLLHKPHKLWPKPRKPNPVQWHNPEYRDKWRSQRVSNLPLGKELPSRRHRVWLFKNSP
jgi:hypothetical protein